MRIGIGHVYLVAYGDSWWAVAELLQNGPVIRTCLSLLTLELCLEPQLSQQLATLSPPFSKSHPRSIRNLFVVCRNSGQCCGTLEVQNLCTIRCDVMSLWFRPSVSLKLWHKISWPWSTERTWTVFLSCGDFLRSLLSLPQSSVNRLRKTSNFRGPHGGWMQNIIFPIFTLCVHIFRR